MDFTNNNKKNEAQLAMKREVKEFSSLVLSPELPPSVYI